jgi:hypothetical protein
MFGKLVLDEFQSHLSEPKLINFIHPAQQGGNHMIDLFDTFTLLSCVVKSSNTRTLLSTRTRTKIINRSYRTLYEYFTPPVKVISRQHSAVKNLLVIIISHPGHHS